MIKNTARILSQTAASRSVWSAWSLLPLSCAVIGPKPPASRTKLLRCLLLLAASAVNAKDLTLETGDGMAIRFSNSGQIVAVQLRGKSLPSSGSPGGIAIREANHNGSFVPLAGKVSGEKNKVRFAATSATFEVEGTFISQRGGIALEGFVHNPSGGERCLD